MLTETREILEYERSFYEELYRQEEDTPEIPVEPPSRTFPKITRMSRDYLDRELSAQELKKH